MCDKLIIKEKARINMRETRAEIFPYEEFQVYILSDDSEPPHLHISKDGWEILFLIDTGELYKINAEGLNNYTYDYIVNNIHRWLDKECSIMPQITNRENANLLWLQLH